MDIDRAYANGDFIAGAEHYPPRWQAKATAFRENLGSRSECNIPYGPAPRQSFDLFHPETTPKGLLVFIHGGYWKAFDKDLWSHLAAGALARGWACVMPGYTLAPKARIAEMTHEIAHAIDAASARVPGPLVVTGHSAGGHLAARMACTNAPVKARIQRCVPISPLSDLTPLIATKMNDILRLDTAEAEAESPANLPQNKHIQTHIWVGGTERPAFLWQARTLSENWNCDWTVAPGKHHFDVIDDLENPASGLMSTLLDGL